MYKNKITQSVIVGLTTLISAVTWSGLKNVMHNDGGWLWPSLGFLFLFILICLTLLLSRSRTLMFVALIFVIAPFSLTFGFKWQIIIAQFLAYGLLAWGSAKILNEKNVRIKINVMRILRVGLPMIITSIALLASVSFFYSSKPQDSDYEIIVPEKLYNNVIDPFLNISFKSLGISKGQLGELSEEDLKKEIYIMMNEKINKQNEQFKKYYGIGLAIGLFFALKVIGVPFGWLVMIIAWLIFKVLVAVGAVKICEQGVLKEVIEV